MALSANAANQDTTSRILNKLNYALANIADDLGTAATGDIFLMLDASDEYKLKYADAANVLEALGQADLSGLTATVAEINSAADVSGRLVDIGDSTTYTVLTANSGKPHIIPNLTGDLTITLPTPAAGLEYRFIYTGVAADAQDWIIDSGSNTNYFLGGLIHADTDAGSAGDEIVAVAGNGSSNSKCTVLTPESGTEVSLVCDGTLWILSGTVASATAPTFADQA